MSDFLLVWALSSVGFRRPARVSEMHLRGTLVFCAVFGAIPAFLYDTQAPPPVDLPETLQSRPALPDTSAN